MTDAPALFLQHEHLPWSLDVTTMGLTPAELDGLDWTRALADMAGVEAGAVANVDEGRQVGHYWLRAPNLAPEVAYATAITAARDAAAALAHKIRSGEATNAAGERFTDVLHIGIGGSQLGPFLLVDALGHDTTGQPRGLRAHFVDNTDPDGIATVLGRIGQRLRTTVVVVVTKSGTTPEPMNAVALTCEALTGVGVRPGDHLVGITVEGSKLDQRAQREGWRAVLPIWPWVGGRYSVTSVVGLFTADLAGIDIEALMSGAAAMDDWTRTQDWRDNPAALLAGAWFLAGGGTGERAMVMLPYADRLVTTSRYLQQLVMESLGKRTDLDGREVFQGLTVYGNKGSTDQHAYVQQLRDGRNDFFATFVQVLSTVAHDPELSDGIGAGDYLQGFLLGTRRALVESGRPALTITVPHVDAYVLGGLIALFERTVGLYASLIGINAFHQPGVEAGKKAAAEVIALSKQLRSLLADGPATTGELAERTGTELLETYYVLQRLERTGRVRTQGGGLDGTWLV